MDSKVLTNADFGDWLSPDACRKDWEEHAIVRSRVGKLGIGFGVGREDISSILATHGCYVFATDQKPDAPNAKEYWGDTGQLATGLDDLFHPNIVSREVFDEHVEFAHLDMNALAPKPVFDFLWSCGSLEHLGSLEKSMAFILNSLGYLKPGGRALHTTEFNLEWNDAHVSEGPTVFFRMGDVLELEARLNVKGYTLLPLNPETDLTREQIDYWPYSSNHRVLESTGVIATSIFLNIHERN